MKVIIFHGWGANSKSNWFPWLEEELEDKFEVYVPDLPNTESPNQNEWLDIALKLKPDENTILVGHSLGSILSMRIMEKIKVRAAFLVSGFDNFLGIDDLKDFFKTELDFETIRKNGKLQMLSSDNDSYIPLHIAKRLSIRLKCKLHIYHKMGHLNNGTGDLKFPELRDMILDEINKKT